jgi:hypothetical protein
MLKTKENVLTYQLTQVTEYGSKRDKLWIAAHMRRNTSADLAATIGNIAGYRDESIAQKMRFRFATMLDAGHTVYYGYGVNNSFALDYLLTDAGEHCSPNLEVDGDYNKLNWAHKIVNKLVRTVEKLRTQSNPNGHERNPGSWSLESLTEVMQALDKMGAVKVERYKDPYDPYFSELVAVK